MNNGKDDEEEEEQEQEDEQDQEAYNDTFADDEGDEELEQAQAATKLQGLFRMRNARFRTMQRRHKAHEENEIKAAVLLQRRWRGTAVRNKMAIRRRKAQEYEVRVYTRKAVVVVGVNVYRELLLRMRRQHTTYPTNTCLH